MRLLICYHQLEGYVMKINKLHISKLRGIVDLELVLNRKSTVIWGPNGVGKSAVVDAIDFLLTGDISRLKGDATGGLSIGKHGPHVGYPPSDAFVKAEITSDDGSAYTVVRNVASKDSILIDEKYQKEFEQNASFSKNCAHFLSRRELLKYILTTPKSRGDQIQTLLNIKEISTTREIIVKTTNKAKAIEKEKQRTLNANENSIKTIAAIQNLSELLNAVNLLREQLGGKHLPSLEKSEFISELTYINQNDNGISQIIDAVESFASRLPAHISAVSESKSELNKYIVQLNKEADKEISQKEIALLKAGLLAMTGDGKCPLCLTQWASEEDLKAFLSERKSKGEIVSNILDSLVTGSNNLIRIITEMAESTRAVKLKLNKIDKKYDDLFMEVEEYLSEFKTLPDLTHENHSLLVDFAEKYISFLSSSKLHTSLLEIVNNLKPAKNEKDSKAATAWKSLNDLNNYYSAYCNNISELSLATKAKEKAELLHKEYNAVQDSVLNNLYQSISSRFVEFYTTMHQADEAEFKANLESSKSGVNLTVDFHGKGLFHPGAYHSEGHQDSMGVALFLALMENLSANLGIVILDDVVMSVDIEHRKNFCKVIDLFFRNHQFIITTHDETWARYLKDEGIISNGNYLHFASWDVDSGPAISVGHDVWENCRQKANAGELSEASAFLRREMEIYFESICDKINASIPYNSSHRWDFGQYMNSAHSKMKDLLRDAKRVAERTNNLTATAVPRK